ncbi:unnamed protein product [Lymnaea stagnalis]|uniref:Lipocalin/cytosolic fatty-acid binding domain-containing protein n=1 Tax=Lymnaea stagnalis TaxID=6523 RepID=A0AAV2IEB9_LYMST
MMMMRMMMQTIVVLVTVCLVASWAQQQYVIMTPGVCPDPPTQSNFDIKRFLGIWNVYECFDTPYIFGMTCVQMVFTQEDDQTQYIRMQIRGLRDVEFFGHSIWRSSVEYDGVGTVINSTYPAEWSVLFGGQPEFDRDNVNYYVLSTDYDSFAVVYGCVRPSPIAIKIETAMILTREPNVKPKTLDFLKYNMKSWGIDTKYFNKISAFNC